MSQTNTTARTVTLTNVWAKSAKTSIPVPPVPGESYRNVGITALEIETGQQYDKVFDSSKYNQFLYEVSSITQLLEQYGILPYSAMTGYPVHAVCLGPDGSPYQALRASGPPHGGAKPLSDAVFWKKDPFQGDIDGKIAAHNGAPDAHDGRFKELSDALDALKETLEEGGGTGGSAGGGTGGTTGKFPHLPVDGGGDFAGTGPGVWRGLVQTASGVALPPGGVWAFFYIAYVSAGNNKYDESFRQRLVGVLPGGTIVNTASGYADYDFGFGFCWRVL